MSFEEIRDGSDIQLAGYPVKATCLCCQVIDCVANAGQCHKKKIRPDIR